MKTKLCSHPGHIGKRLLPVTAFSPHPGTQDGYQSICKNCNRRLARERARRLARERRKEQNREKHLLDYKEVPAEVDYIENIKEVDWAEEFEDIPEDIPLKDL